MPTGPKGQKRPADVIGNAVINARRPAGLGSLGLSKLARLREVDEPRQLLKTPRVFAPKSL